MNVQKDIRKDTKIKLNLFNCSELKNLKITQTKYSIVVQGEDYCKMYEKIKNVEILEENNQIFVHTTLGELKNKLNSKSPNIKLTKLLNNVFFYENNKNEKIFFNNEKNINKINCFANLVNKLEQYELSIKQKEYLLYKENLIIINTNSSLNFRNSKYFVEEYKNYQIQKKIKGGIVFYDFISKDEFQKTFNKIDNLTDDIVKNLFIFDSSDLYLINECAKIKNNKSRLIIYHPTNDILIKIKDFKKYDVIDPYFIWIILPQKSIHSIIHGLDLIQLLSTLFWENNNFFFEKKTIESLSEIIFEITDKTNSCASTSTNTNANQIDNDNKNSHEKNNMGKITIEKIRYKLTSSEKKLFPSITYEDLSILDKICIYNLDNKMPKKIFECNECPICCANLEENKNNIFKSYLSCGHLFCSECVIRSMKIKQCCPSCRFITKLEKINIPDLKSNKVKILLKIITRILCDKILEKPKIILIYVDSCLFTKKITNFVKNNIENINCVGMDKNNVNNRDNINTDKILVCSIDKEFLIKNIKNISDIIVFTTTKYILKNESLGYDFCNQLNGVKLWLPICKDVEI